MSKNMCQTQAAGRGAWQGKSNEVVPKLKQDMATILVTNWKVWIPFQFFNFNLVPVQLQVRPKGAQMHCYRTAPSSLDL